MVDCYHKAGTKSKKTAPCNHTALIEGKHTHCCEPGDLCLTNGLCREETVNNATNYAWRFGCTDPTFKDPACATEYCDSKPETKDQDTKLTWQCTNENTWCCSTGEPLPQEARANRTNTTCCTMDNLLFKAPGPDVYTTASLFGTLFSVGTRLTSSRVVSNATASPSLPIATTSSVNTAILTPIASDIAVPPSSGPSGLAIGLGAGLGSFAVIALGIGSFCLWRRRRRNADLPQHVTSAKELSNHGLAEASSSDRAEMTAMEYRRELASPVSPVELWSPAEPQRVELPGEEKGRLMVGEMDAQSRN